VGEARFSAPVQTVLASHPATYKMCTESFLGVKRLGRGGEHPHPSSTEVKEKVVLRHLGAFTACSRVTLTFTYAPDSTGN